jgi:hypothetical protein
MQCNSVVDMAAEIEAAKRVYFAADDARDWPEVRRLGLLLTSLERVECKCAPTSNAGAAQKLRNLAADWRCDPGATPERFARSAVRLAGNIKRGDVTDLTLRALRGLMPTALRHDREVDGTATAHALTHAIDWCARLRVV